MELVKPEPLIIGGRAHYTLTSYDPVTIEVDVPYATDEDVMYAMQATVMQAGGGPAELGDDAWIREHFNGVSGADELRVAVRDQVRAMNAQMAEEQKATKCADELVKRLMQAVPQSQIARLRNAFEQLFRENLRQEGLTESDFRAQTGMRPGDLEAMFDEQAKTSAEHEAAIDAWADNRRVEVRDDEIPQVLGIAEEAVDQFLDSIRAAGQMEEVRQTARRNKAMGIIVAECHCTYHHESPAEAAARVAYMQAEQQAFMSAMSTPEPPENDHPHLKLV